jgi:TetR/AcrR family transcriptional regulator, mexJK operon transcriptional repressor
VRKNSTSRTQRHSSARTQLLVNQACKAVSKGKTVADACRSVGVSEATYYRLRAAKAGGAGRIRQLARNQIRSEIITAARELFLREGRAVGLDEVAKAADVARQTLYNLFGNKQALFRAVVHENYARSLGPVLHLEKKQSVRDTLLAYGRQFLVAALDDETIALLRLTVAELRDFPDLGKILYEATSRHALALADYFRSQIDAGRLREFDTVAAALSFGGGLTSHARYLALLGAGTESAQRRQATLEVTVDTFARGLSYKARNISG